MSGVMIQMPQRITLTSAERPCISAERPRMSRVMIQMPQRITSHLGRAPSHIWSDDSDAPADHLTSRQSTLPPLE